MIAIVMAIISREAANKLGALPGAVLARFFSTESIGPCLPCHRYYPPFKNPHLRRTTSKEADKDHDKLDVRANC